MNHERHPIKDLQHEARFRAFETEKKTEVRKLAPIDDIWKKVWDKWVRRDK